jgi:hypothetical protein
MANLNGYRLIETGPQVQEAITQVREKTIYPDASQSVHGLMSTTDKTKLDNLEDMDALTILEIDELLNF